MKTKLKLLPDDVLTEAAECLKVMAHPVRLKIVNVLAQGRFAVHEISALAGTSPNQTCGHLRLLQAHGLLVSERCGARYITRSLRLACPSSSGASAIRAANDRRYRWLRKNVS